VLIMFVYLSCSAFLSRLRAMVETSPCSQASPFDLGFRRFLFTCKTGSIPFADHFPKIAGGYSQIPES